MSMAVTVPNGENSRWSSSSLTVRERSPMNRIVPSSLPIDAEAKFDAFSWLARAALYAA